MVMVTLAEADFVLSAWAIAAMVAVGGEGKIAGAVYTPAPLIVPKVGSPVYTVDLPHYLCVATALNRRLERKLTARLHAGLSRREGDAHCRRRGG